jgi:hypothetical protein
MSDQQRWNTLINSGERKTFDIINFLGNLSKEVLEINAYTFLNDILFNEEELNSFDFLLKYVGTIISDRLLDRSIRNGLDDKAILLIPRVSSEQLLSSYKNIRSDQILKLRLFFEDEMRVRGIYQE